MGPRASWPSLGSNGYRVGAEGTRRLGRSPHSRRVHEDCGIISYERAPKKLVLRQFHIEGFVNQFAADSAAGGALQFTSESIEIYPRGGAREDLHRH